MLHHFVQRGRADARQFGPGERRVRQSCDRRWPRVGEEDVDQLRGSRVGLHSGKGPVILLSGGLGEGIREETVNGLGGEEGREKAGSGLGGMVGGWIVCTAEVGEAEAVCGGEDGGLACMRVQYV